MDEFVSGQDFTALEFSLELINVSVHKDFDHLEELIFEDDLFILRKDVEDVANHHVLVMRLLRQDPHDQQE
jgi:hypothetical protein